MSNTSLTTSIPFLVLLSVLALSFVPQVAAFGAGNIPSYSYLEHKAFRHGDIEDILQNLSKSAGTALFGMALGSGKKFTPLDVKRVYFGNWLRDYSQAVDVAGLKKVPLQTIMNIVMALGFLAHGYATREFEVTSTRLGCYLPTEHIDNPKGYAKDEAGGDARKYDSRLRGPVDDRELEVDTRTGMKNYIANEDGNWDTSKALVRRVLEACIHFGRQAQSSGREEDKFEAYRLLGQALHTLEDFSAHSNWCELALQQMGHRNVFPHVGQNATVQAPNGQRVPILVTGTFGGSDFLHSLIGESSDHLSSASVSDLNAKVAGARSTSDSGGGNNSILRSLLFDLPGSSGQQLSREMDEVTNMRAGQPGGFDPMNMSPQEMHDVLWKVMAFRDNVMIKIESTIELIPGLGPLISKISDSINVFIFTTLEPYLKPLLSTATGALGTAGAEVINDQEQFKVFNDPNASDPSHSFLSKDHFNLILNEPGGLVAQVIVEHTVGLVVKAWNESQMDTRQVTADVLSCLFHPMFHDPRSQIQVKMMDKMKAWFNAESPTHQKELINRLTIESVRNHKNIRIADPSGHMHSMLGDGGLQAAIGNQMPSFQQMGINRTADLGAPITTEHSSSGNSASAGAAAQYLSNRPAASASSHPVHQNQPPMLGQAQQYHSQPDFQQQQGQGYQEQPQMQQYPSFGGGGGPGRYGPPMPGPPGGFYGGGPPPPQGYGGPFGGPPPGDFNNNYQQPPPFPPYGQGPPMGYGQQQFSGGQQQHHHQSQGRMVTCPQCTLMNPSRRDQCQACGMSLEGL